MNKQPVLIFTDGGSFANKKVSNGFDASCAYLIWCNNKRVVQDGEYLPNKTNNFAEMYAIYKTLKLTYEYSLSTSDTLIIDLVTDSELCKKSLTEWFEGWLKNEYHGVLYNSKKEPVANQELIKLAKLYMERLQSRGHVINIRHINSHKAASNIAKDCEKFNKKNNTKLTVEEYTVYYKCNDICDKMVKDVFASKGRKFK